MKKDPKVDARRVGLAATIVAVVWFVLGVYVLHAAVEPESDALPLERTIGIERLLPQRWAVFTIDTKIQYPLPFRRRGETWVPVEPSYRGNQFGFDRAIMAPITEAHELTQGLDQSQWARCDRILSECLAALEPVEVENESNIPRLCGDVAVAKRPVTAWEDRAGGAGAAKPFDIVLLKVQC